MKFKETIITDTGIAIDPDDDVDIIKHDKLYEIRYDAYCIYCNRFYPYNSRLNKVTMKQENDADNV